ncbi:thermonuclease family protein [Candidatus Omnitrophota bacterium]
MRKQYLCIFLLLFFLSSCADADYDLITIAEVIDGDTLALANGRHLRLIGLDTPETKKKTAEGFVDDPAPFSLEAARFTRELAQGASCRVEFDLEKEDRYRRLLGYCFIQTEGSPEIFLNEQLLAQGYAVLYTYPPNTKYVDRFVAAQRLARREKKGLWGGYEVIAPHEAGAFLGQIRTVRGRVVSTHHSPKVILLNFGGDYRTDFSVAIFKNSFEYFHKQGIVPEVFYKDKTVSVSGRIREYNGPEIIANIPEEIEVIE